jgi:hypothetical protein
VLLMILMIPCRRNAAYVDQQSQGQHTVWEMELNQQYHLFILGPVG